MSSIPHLLSQTASIRVATAGWVFLDNASLLPVALPNSARPFTSSGYSRFRTRAVNAKDTKKIDSGSPCAGNTKHQTLCANATCLPLSAQMLANSLAERQPLLARLHTVAFGVVPIMTTVWGHTDYEKENGCLFRGVVVGWMLCMSAQLPAPKRVGLPVSGPARDHSIYPSKPPDLVAV